MDGGILKSSSKERAKYLKGVTTMNEIMNEVTMFASAMNRKTMKKVDGHNWTPSVAREQGRAEAYRYMSDILFEISEGNFDEARKLMDTLWNRD